MRLVRIRKLYYRCKNRIAHCEVESFHDTDGQNIVIATELSSNFRGPEIAKNLIDFLRVVRTQLDCAPDETFRLFERWTPDSYVPRCEEGAEISEITFVNGKPKFTHTPEDEWNQIYKKRKKPWPKIKVRRATWS